MSIDEWVLGPRVAETQQHIQRRLHRSSCKFKVLIYLFELTLRLCLEPHDDDDDDDDEFISNISGKNPLIFSRFFQLIIRAQAVMDVCVLCVSGERVINDGGGELNADRKRKNWSPDEMGDI